MKNSPNLSKRITIPCKPDFGLLEKTYRKNELIVTFKCVPTPEEEKEVKDYFDKMGYPKIEIFRYDNCELPVQLWQAAGIDTVVSGNGVKAGTGPGTKTVGENYSLNFLSKIPQHHWNLTNKNPNWNITPRSTKGDIITIAVLDTGIDPFIVDPGYIATNITNIPGHECFADSPGGWNFIDDNVDIEDDNPGRHGSLVAQFIINEFKKSPTKTLQILPLKTHDRDGHGDLFKIFCAVYYAVAKGAKIINASWGFYYYEGEEFEQLKKLIGELKEEGVLFITAAGNKSDDDDKIATDILAHRGIVPTPSQLRDLAIHHFLPANLSDKAENLITVTTCNEDIVSATENYSKKFVDLGVIADKSENSSLLFKVPFEQIGTDEHIGGSSFATAIATGIIGANCNTALYTKDKINKKLFIDDLMKFSQNLRGVGLCQKFPALGNELIKDGICLQKRPEV
jgi:hypothetical protein